VESLAPDRLLLLPNATVNGAREEFMLSAPLRGVLLGDEVRISYKNENGRRVALRIEEISSRQ
jgi:hypothetical protein